jgi:hypothetical protein
MLAARSWRIVSPRAVALGANFPVSRGPVEPCAGNETLSRRDAKKRATSHPSDKRAHEAARLFQAIAQDWRGLP